MTGANHSKPCLGIADILHWGASDKIGVTWVFLLGHSLPMSKLGF